jgi:hypothetical protein
VSASHPDVIVLDLDPAEADSHVEQIRCLPADVPAVVVGDDGGVAELARAAGAWFVDKADAADLLLRSVLLAGRRDDLTAR